MQHSPRRSAPTVVSFIILAGVSGAVMVLAVVLWVADVIPLGAMIAAVAVLGVAEIGVVLLLQRRARAQIARTEHRASGTSTIHDSPGTRYGYDPMDGLDGRSGR